MMDDFFSKAHELVQQGVPFVTATVVRAENPTSGKPGDKAIVSADGVMHGWIGGSCAQPTVIRESLKALKSDESILIRLSPDPSQLQPRPGLIDLPMTCFSGGTLEIFLEPQHPRPRLVVVGNLPVAQALTQLASDMNYHVIAVDPDGSGASLPHADEVLETLDEVGEQIRPLTFVVVATHGNYDELALERILAARPPYVGLVASKQRAAAVREYLALQGFGEEEMAVLKAPAGLDIQARRGDEIALSIMVEIVQKRRNLEALELALFGRQSAAEEAPVASMSLEMIKTKTAVAIDPICNMEVETASAQYTFEHEGIIYYFCCPGCKTRFAKSPEQYLANA